VIWHIDLRPVHTKDDNYKDIVLKIVLKSRVHTTAIMLTAQRNDIVGITFKTILSS